MEIKELYHYMVNATEEQNDQAIEVLSDIMSEIKRKFPIYYAKYDKRLEEIYKHNEQHLNRESAMHAVSKLKNSDGTTGPHWSESDIKEVVNTYPELKKYCFWDLYYVMNMIYSDYYASGYTLKDYIHLAANFINDKDAPEDKVKRYISAMQSY